MTVRSLFYQRPFSTFAIASCLVLILMATSVHAELATPQEMERVSQNWLTYTLSKTGDWGGSSSPTITGAHELKSNDTLLGICYSIDPIGYILVPVLKELPPIKAHSYESNLNVNDTGGFAQLLREVLSQKMGLYADVYGDLQTKQSALAQPLFDEKNRASWDKLAVSPEQFAATLTAKSTTIRQAGPLLTTVWHQGEPYNNYCPIGNGGVRCPVGCVATAAAQIMAYWQWPTEGTGSHTYIWPGDGDASGGYLSADFYDSYEWDNIPNYCDPANPTCTPEFQAALAELNYEVGVAFNMYYAVAGSGAYTLNAAWIFPTYFVYMNTTEIREHSAIDPVAWFAIIQDEINAGRPIQYRINLHSIVCDGWRIEEYINQVHMNYGWGGGNNAWYTVDELYCPWEGCDPTVEAMVINIIPDKSVMFSADVRVGLHPLEVNFDGSSELTVDFWEWEFGDGNVAHTEDPSNTYTLGGMFDVTLQVRDTLSRTKTDYIIVLADSLVGEDIETEPGADVEMTVHANNIIPVNYFKVPVEYSGDLNVTLDSFSTAGLRTEYFDIQNYINIDPGNKRHTIKLMASSNGSQPELEPGAGPIVKLYFSISSSASTNSTTPVVFDGYGTHYPTFYGSLLDDTQIFLASGSLSNPGCCVYRGDVNHSGTRDISDLTYYVEYLFNLGSAPPCYEEGDINASGTQDISDLTFYVDYLFNAGPEPPPCY